MLAIALYFVRCMTSSTRGMTIGTLCKCVMTRHTPTMTCKNPRMVQLLYKGLMCCCSPLLRSSTVHGFPPVFLSSVLENHHISAAFMLMKTENLNFLQHLHLEDFKEFRRIAIEVRRLVRQRKASSASKPYAHPTCRWCSQRICHATWKSSTSLK